MGSGEWGNPGINPEDWDQDVLFTERGYVLKQINLTTLVLNTASMYQVIVLEISF